MVWTPVSGGPRLILPRLEGETGGQTVQRYENGINATRGFDPLLAKAGDSVATHGKLKLPSGIVSPLRGKSSSLRATSFLVAANDFPQMMKGADKKSSPKVLAILQGLKADTYMLPVAADIGLSEKDAAEFREKVAHRFDAMLALGGDDIDPALYGQKNTHALNIVPERDQPEFKMLQTKIRSEHGVVYGICRGHQLCAVAHGHELIQDIPSELGEEANNPQLHSPKESLTHRIKVDRSSMLYALSGQDEMWVNSYHHQAVIEKPGSGLISVAKNEEPPSVVEATEFENGRGFTFQFHPEIVFEGHEPGPENLGIMKLMVDYASAVKNQGPFYCLPEAFKRSLY